MMLADLLGNKSEMYVIPPGVDHSRFSQKNPTKRKNQLLFVGRVAKEKNIEALINAMSMVTTPCLLTIVGNGKSFKKIDPALAWQRG